MGFLHTEIAENGEDFLLVKELWYLLKGDSNNGVTMQNLLKMLLVLRGVDVQPNFTKDLKTLTFYGVAEERNGEVTLTE